MFLGINIGSHVNWKSHIYKLCTKLSKYVFVIRRIRRNAGKDFAQTKNNSILGCRDKMEPISKTMIYQCSCVMMIKSLLQST